MSRFLNVVLTESPLDSPFAPKEKNAGFLAGLAAMAGLGNLASQEDANSMNWQIAKLNAGLQGDTNRQNYKIWQESKAHDKYLMDTQNAFNFDMWNKQNAYNSPQHQVEMMKAAGLNPSMMYGQATPASSLSSAQANHSPAPNMVAPRLDYRVNPLDYGSAFDAVGQAVNAFYDNQLKNEQAKKVSADGQISAANANFQTQRNMLELMKIRSSIDHELADTKLSESTRDYYETLRDQVDQALDLQQAQWDDLIVKEKKNNLLTDATTDNMVAQAASHRAQAHLTNVIAEFQGDLMQSQINLNDSNAQAAIQSVATMVAEGQLSTQKAISQELQNKLDFNNVKKEVIKSRMRNGKRFIRRTLNAIELVSESLASGVRGIIKW